MVQPKKKSVMIRLPQEVYAYIEQQAKKSALPVATKIRTILTELANKESKKEAKK